jgi:hypothetical protein
VALNALLWFSRHQIISLEVVPFKQGRSQREIERSKHPQGVAKNRKTEQNSSDLSQFYRAKQE